MNQEFTFGVRVQASGSRQAGAELDALRKSAKGLGDEFVETSADAQKLIDRYDPLGAKLRALQGDFNALSNAAKNGMVGPNDDRRMDAVYKNLNTEIARTKEAMAGVTAANGQFAQSSKMASYQLAMLPAQMTDIAVGLQGGMSPFTVLLQQGGQIKDMFGGVGPAMRAVGGYVMDLVNPFTVAAAAVAGLGYAYYAGSQESSSMDAALRKTSNMAGQTSGSLRGLAQEMEAHSTLTIGQSKDIATALAASGRISSDAFHSISLAAGNFQRVTGYAMDQVAAEMVKVFESPAKGAEQLNASMHILNGTELEHLAALERQGRLSEAQVELADKLKDRMVAQVKPLNTLGELLNRTAKDASNFWDSLMGVGREDTLDEKLSAARQKLLRAKAGVFGGGSVSQAQADLDALQAEKDAADAEAAAKEKKAEQERDNAAAMKNVMALSPTKRLADLADRRKSVSGFEPANGDEAAWKAEALRSLDAERAGIDGTLVMIDSALASSEQRWKAYSEHVASLRRQAEIGDRQAIEEQGMAEQKTLDARIAAARQRLAVEANPAGQARLRSEISRLNDEKLAAEGRVNDQLTELDQKRRNDELVADADAMRKRGQVAEAFILDWVAKNNATLKTALADGNTALVGSLQAQLEAGIQSANFDKASKAFEAKIASMNAQIASAKTAAVTGAGPMFSEADARAVRAAGIPALDELSDRMRTFAGDSDEAKKKLGELSVKLEELKQQAQGDWATGMRGAVQEYNSSVSDSAAVTKNAWAGSLRAAENDLTTSLMKRRLDISNFASYVAAEYLRINAVQPFVGALSKWGSSAIDGFFNNGNVGAGQVVQNTPTTYSVPVDMGTAPIVLPNAKGGMYSSPDLHQYANQLVSSPTYFRFAKGGSLGVAGEVPGETEAIVPLKRGPNGTLGVANYGGGGGNAPIVFSPTISIDARGAAVGVGPLIKNLVDQSLADFKVSIMSEMAGGGPMAYATGRRKS